MGSSRDNILNHPKVTRASDVNSVYLHSDYSISSVQ